MTDRGPEPQAPVVPHLAAWWVLAIGLVAGVVAGAMQRPLWATGIFALSCVAAAVLRLVLSPYQAGGLVVRSRWLDASILAGLGIAVGIIGRLMNLHPRI